VFLFSFPDGTEVTFNCIGNIIDEKVTWRIRCEDGNWIGRSLNCSKSFLAYILLARANKYHLTVNFSETCRDHEFHFGQHHLYVSKQRAQRGNVYK